MMISLFKISKEQIFKNARMPANAEGQNLVENDFALQSVDYPSSIWNYSVQFMIYKPKYRLPVFST